MNKIRVLHIIESLSLGGAERRLINDLKFIDKSKFENAVCTLFNRTPLEEEIRALHIPVFKPELRDFKDVLGFYRLIALIKSFRPHIVHTQLFWADVLGRITAWISGVPIIVTTVQSSVYEPDAGYLFSRKRQCIDLITGHFFNRRYIAVSESVKNSISRRLGVKAEKIEVIYNSIDFNDFKKNDAKQESARLKNELGVTAAEIVLVTVGRLNPPKGHQFLFKALALIKPYIPSFKLFVIGDGPIRKELEAHVTTVGLRKEIIFLGQRNDVKELLALSDIFVFPTLSEGMPISLLEAMALAVPCIASSIEPIREVITDSQTGYLFQPADSHDLASAIRRVCESTQLRKKVGLRGAEFVKSKFDAVKGAVQLGRLYENILNGDSRI